jgi:hypothetical protein
LSIGHDSWQAEQRSPYFLAKAGRAFAGWLALRTRNTTITTAVRTDVADCNLWSRPDRVNIDMADSSNSIVILQKDKQRVF